jgi:tetraacyldisaccharide 4'-kinase
MFQNEPEIMLFTKNPYLAAALCVIFLPFTIIYYLAVTVRHFLYDYGLIRSYRPDIPTVSVGNITVGGTGKTPTVISLVNSLLEKGFNSLVVTGGYGRKSSGRVTITENTPVSESGDEPLTIYRKTKAKVVCDRDRTSAMKDLSGNFDIAVLDDAFQHRKLKKHLDIVLIDEGRFLGNHLLLPSGILRDKISRLKYADVIILSKVQDVNSASVKDKLSCLKKFGKKILISKLDYSFVTDGIKKTGLKDVLAMNISLFCGIGNPDDFFNIFSSYKIISKKAFSDHCSFTGNELAELKRLKRGSDIMITTYKDFVKIPDGIIKEFDIRFLEIDLKFYTESLTEFDISDLTKGILIGKK